MQLVRWLPTLTLSFRKEAIEVPGDYSPLQAWSAYKRVLKKFLEVSKKESDPFGDLKSSSDSDSDSSRKGKDDGADARAAATRAYEESRGIGVEVPNPYHVNECLRVLQEFRWIPTSTRVLLPDWYVFSFSDPLLLSVKTRRRHTDCASLGQCRNQRILARIAPLGLGFSS